MKILMICEFFPSGRDLKFSGGVEARTFFIAKHLSIKHKILVVTSFLPTSKRYEKLDRIEIFRVGPQRKYKASFGSFYDRLKFTFSAIRFAKTLKVDLIEGTNFLTHLACSVVAKSLKVPSVAWYPDVWLGSWIKLTGPSGIFGEILERINLILGARAYIAISKATAQKLEKFTDKKIYTIPCGVDLEEFKTKVKKSPTPTIICISRLVSYKRIMDLLFAFALILKKGIKANLLIIGQGPQEKELNKVCQMLKIERKVRFTHNLTRDDLINKIKSSTVFCLPSEVEGFGISVIEAAASGVPYVISDIDVFKEVTKNGQGGLIFRLGDIKDLSSKIARLLTNQKLYAAKTREALGLAKNYQWPKIAKKTEAVYESIRQ